MLPQSQILSHALFFIFSRSVKDLSEFFSVISEEMKKQEEWNSHFKPPDFSNEINSLVETISKVDLFKSSPKKKIKKVKTKKIPIIVEEKTDYFASLDISYKEED